MAVRTRDEILTSLNKLIGDKQDDETLAFIEDVTDTLSQPSQDQDLKAENDKLKQDLKDQDDAWRKKYRERFFSAPVEPDPAPSGADQTPEPEKPLTFDALFAPDKT